MAKKKQAKRQAPEPMVVVAPGCSLDLQFSRELQKEPETLRRLGHLVVDLLADGGRYDWLAESAACSLGCLADDMIVNNVTDLICEARAASKEVARG